jgi:hypothetical protein
VPLRGGTGCRRLWSRVGGDELDLEAIGVGEVGGVVIGPASVRMPVGEQQRPAECRSFSSKAVDVLAGSGVEREMVQSGSQPVVLSGGQRGRLLDHEISGAEAPAAPVRPLLERRVSKLHEEPSPLSAGTPQVRHPQLYVVQAPGHGTSFMRTPIWAWIIFFIIGGIVYLVMLPKRRRDAADRKRLFEEPQQKDAER